LQLTEVKDAAILGMSTDVELNSLHDGPENSIVELSREVHPRADPKNTTAGADYLPDQCFVADPQPTTTREI